MTFIFDSYFESVFLYLENATANCTAEKWMHVVDACFWLLPLTTANSDHLCVELMKENGQTN